MNDNDPKLVAMRQHNMKLEDVIMRQEVDMEQLRKRIKQLEEAQQNARSVPEKDSG